MAYNYGLLWIYYGLLWCIVAYFFGATWRARPPVLRGARRAPFQLNPKVPSLLQQGAPINPMILLKSVRVERRQI